MTTMTMTAVLVLRRDAMWSRRSRTHRLCLSPQVPKGGGGGVLAPPQASRAGPRRRGSATGERAGVIMGSPAPGWAQLAGSQVACTSPLPRPFPSPQHGPEAKAQVLCLRPVGPGSTSSTMGRGAKSIRTQMHVGQGGAASPAPRLSSTMLPCFPHKATVWKAGVEQGEVVCGATAGARQGQELAGTLPAQGHSLTASVLSV